FRGDVCQIQTPNWLLGPVEFPLGTALESAGAAVYPRYPMVRLVILAASVVIGIVGWLVVNGTPGGLVVRGGADDRGAPGPAGGALTCRWSRARIRPVSRERPARRCWRGRNSTSLPSGWWRRSS